MSGEDQVDSVSIYQTASDVFLSKCHVSDAEPGEDQVSDQFPDLSSFLSVRFRMLSLVNTRSQIDSLNLVPV
jgi:hypothetical protein